jgi:thiosulfate dehydrogenase
MTSRALFTTVFLTLLFGVLAAVLFSRDMARPPEIAANGASTKASPSASAIAWPDYSANGLGFQTPARPDGELVAQGYRQVSQTFAEIGPEVADPARRFAGNNLSCQNCHIDGGTNRHALPLVGVFNIYPRFLTRSGRVVSLPERVNQCMTRSMNGRPLPDDSPEMAAFLAYFKFIGGPEAVHAEPAPPPPVPASVERGAVVYADVCALCHKPDGLGVRVGSKGDADGYSFPPLWGPDSFNDGAGMDRFDRAVSFIRHNMPRGVDPAHPQLSLQQAWDVVAYLRAQPRPRGPER